MIHLIVLHFGVLLFLFCKSRFTDRTANRILLILLPFKYTHDAFGCAVALVRGCTADHFPSVVPKPVKLFFDLTGLHRSAPKTFCIKSDHFVLELFHF